MWRNNFGRLPRPTPRSLPKGTRCWGGLQTRIVFFLPRWTRVRSLVGREGCVDQYCRCLTRLPGGIGCSCDGRSGLGTFGKDGELRRQVAWRAGLAGQTGNVFLERFLMLPRILGDVRADGSELGEAVDETASAKRILTKPSGEVVEDGEEAFPGAPPACCTVASSPSVQDLCLCSSTAMTMLLFEGNSA